jgi:hypothetical protein
MNRFKEDKYNSWLRTILLSICFVLLWCLFGFILSHDLFDSIYFNTFKILSSRTDTLSYLAVIFAIQIPIFILFLQQMVEAKYVKRVVLPRITNFKEIIISLVVGTTLVLVSQRNSFIYFPIFILFIVNILAIFKALTLTFHQEQYLRDIQKYLEKIARQSFQRLVLKRRNNNSFFKHLELFSFIKLSFLAPSIPKDMKKIKILSNKSGFLKNIDLISISRAMIREFPFLDPSPISNGSQIDIPKEKPSVLLRNYPPNSIIQGECIAEVIVPSSFDSQKRLIQKLSEAFSIEPSPELPIKYFDEIISAFGRGFSELAEPKKISELQELIKLYDIFTSSFDKQIQSEKTSEDKYSLQQSFLELRRLNDDDLGKRLYKLYEVYSDAFSRAIEYSQAEVADELLHTAYGALIDTSRENYQSSIARWDSIFTDSLSLFLYKNSWNEKLTDKQTILLDKIVMRLGEHTSLLSYSIEKKQIDEISEEKTLLLEHWLRHRIDRLRSNAIQSYKKNNKKIFDKLFTILLKLQDDSYPYTSPDLEYYSKYSIFMIGAYFEYKNDRSSPQAKSILSVTSSWKPDELLKVFIECVENNYADIWHIDTYDYDADGTVYSVPDYKEVLKRLWINSMINMPAFPSEVEYYNENKILEKTILFSGGSNSESFNTFFELVEQFDIDPIDKDSMKELIRSFANVRYSWESKELIERRIDEAKVEDFRNKVNDSYVDSSVSINVFRSSENLVIEDIKKRTGFKQYGINSVFEKEAFLSDWHTGYMMGGMAEDIGRDTANSEDSIIFSELLNPYTILNDFESFISTLKDGNRWIIIANKISTWEIQYKQSLYINNQSNGDKFYFKNVKQNVSIQNIYIEGLPSGVYAIQDTSLGRIIRRPNSFDKQVDVNIYAFSDNAVELDRLLKSSPKWLASIGTFEDQKQFLLKRVRMVTERVFKFEKQSSTTVYFTPMSYDE